jgi:hypothetical protein
MLRDHLDDPMATFSKPIHPLSNIFPLNTGMSEANELVDSMPQQAANSKP